MNNLKEIPTCELVEELKKRDGVRTFDVGVEEMHRIQKAGFEPNTRRSIMGTGPAIILEVID